MSASHDPIGENGLGTFSDNDPHLLCSTPIPENSVGAIDFHVACRRVSDGAGKVWSARIGFKRGTGDAVEFGLNIPSPMGTVGDLLALAAVSIDISASGENIDVAVTGLNTEMDWSCLPLGRKLVHVEE